MDGIPTADIQLAEERVSLILMDGPVLVFGGCYSNLEATRAVLRIASERRIPPRRIICTGDVVAYGADARATVRLIRRSHIHVVMGNCEESLGIDAEDCGCGFEEGSACDRLSAAWYAHARSQLDEDARSWMRALPRRIDVEIGGRRLAVVHGGVEVINEFLFAAAPEERLAREIDVAGCDGVIAGHCGLPFSRIVDGRLWHNSGAIGLPANDGTPATWYSLLVPGAEGIAIEHRALDYDHEAAARKMRGAGLPEGYAGALETGLWPSCDVLPEPELAHRGLPLEAGPVFWPAGEAKTRAVWPLSRSGRKFDKPEVTASGERRASIRFSALQTLWFNTGTLCNIACQGCYIESSPRNDRLAYIGRAEVREFLAEATAGYPELEEIGFTGGEPFLNPDILGMIEDALSGGWRVLVLTNAMRPMQRVKGTLARIYRRFPERLTLRVSLDHYTRRGHEKVRGNLSWEPTIAGLKWLAENGFDFTVASRMVSEETAAEMRAGYGALFARLGIGLDVEDAARLVLFPEMDRAAQVPEITEGCWNALGVDPETVMCASSRMVVKRRGADRPTVVSCTLLPYEDAFEMGVTLAQASRPVPLNHPYCAQFCVLGGASCSARRAGGPHS